MFYSLEPDIAETSAFQQETDEFDEFEEEADESQALIRREGKQPMDYTSENKDKEIQMMEIRGERGVRIRDN